LKKTTLFFSASQNLPCHRFKHLTIYNEEKLSAFIAKDPVHRGSCVLSGTIDESGHTLKTIGKQ
jgi:hypothetical protein